MRVFLAVELPAELRERIVAAAEPLLADVSGARRVAGENLHVTCRFLGELDADRLDALRSPLAAAAARVTAVTARAAGWGAFPPTRASRASRAPRVIWCGVTAGSEHLQGLEREVGAALAAHGFPPEQRAYHPHITVARIGGRRAPRTPGAELARRLQAPVSFGDFPVRGLTVFRSHLPRTGERSGERTGPRYEVLDRLPLRTTHES